MKRSKSIVIGSMIFALVVLEVLICFPTNAFEEKPRPLPRITSVVIGGHVKLPGGRGLREVKIHLYEIRDGGQRFVKETITNSEGFYSLMIGGGERNVWLVPNYAAFGFGEHFSPPEYRFSITSVTRRTERNFRYTGPLPDLLVPEPAGNVKINLVDGTCRFFFPIKNAGELEARPFKVKVRYWDRSAGYGPRAILKEKIVRYPYSLDPGHTGAIYERGGWGVVLGPGTAGDDSPPGQRMSLESASGRYEVTLVELDCEDAVFESIEGNNRFP
jgi:hypothetical protein